MEAVKVAWEAVVALVEASVAALPSPTPNSTVSLSSSGQYVLGFTGKGCGAAFFMQLWQHDAEKEGPWSTLIKMGKIRDVFHVRKFNSGLRGFDPEKHRKVRHGSTTGYWVPDWDHVVVIFNDGTVKYGRVSNILFTLLTE